MIPEIATQLNKAIRQGFRCLIQAREGLDRTNVFPVADADTGTNLVETLRFVEDDTLALSGHDEAFRETLLMGGRGNSGILLSGFLSGLLAAMDNAEGVFANLGLAFRHGRDQAYRSVAEPRQGTILTAMDAVASAGERLSCWDTRNACEVLASVLDTVEASSRQIEVNQKAGVADAGALGFLIFMLGFFEALIPINPEFVSKLWSRISDWLARTPDRRALAVSGVGVSATGLDTVCLELVIREFKCPGESWLEDLKRMGSSIEWSRQGQVLKLHIHTAHLDQVRQWADQQGRGVAWRLSSTTVTDGLLASADVLVDEVRHSSEAFGLPCRILTDSSASLPPWLARREAISVFHNHVRIGDQVLRDDEVTSGILYEAMGRGVTCTTAKPSPEEVRRFLEMLLETPGPLCYIGVGPRYTSGIALVSMAIQALGAQDRVRIFDTHAASGQQALVALAASRYSRYAKAGLDRYIEDRITLAREYLVLDTLEHLARGGRIGKLSAFFGNLLSVKPIVGHGPDGPAKRGAVRSAQEAMDFIIDDLSGFLEDNPDVLVLIEETDQLDITKEMSNHLKRILGFRPGVEILHVPLSASAGVHMGPGTWGVAVVPL